jgi:hypothetical protein
MRDWNPKSLWDELLRAFHGWMDEQDDEQARDPTFLFHLLFTAPLLLGILAMMTRHA